MDVKQNHSRNKHLFLSLEDEVERASNIFESWLREIGLEEGDEISRFMILCTEALANAKEHGSKSPDQHISLSYRVKKYADKKYVEIVVKDEGNGFDTTKIPDSRYEERLGEEKGRGLIMIKKYADKINWNRKGNIIYIRRALHCKE